MIREIRGIRAVAALAVFAVVALAGCSPATRSQMQSSAEAHGTTYDDWEFSSRAAPGFLYRNYTSIPQSPGGGG
jgi:hypothetical protein